MFVSNVIVLSLAAFALANPTPQATTDMGSSPTDSGLSPSEAAGLASISDSLASLSSVNSILSGAPTLDPSIEAVLITAVETAVAAGETCVTTTPAWYYSLPSDVKSALSSYDIAWASWYAIHSAELPDITQTLPGNICTGTIFNEGSGESTTLATGTASAGHATATAGVTATAKTTGSATKGTTGTATAASGSSGSASSSSKAAAPRATGAIGASLAGVVGVFGLMVAL